MTRTIDNATGAQTHLGYSIEIDDDKGRVAVSLVVGDEHFNRHGTVHGGIVAALLDTVCGMQCSFDNDPELLPPCVSLTLTTNFVAPVRRGRVIATARSEGGGQRVRYLSGRLEDESGALLATASAVMRMV